MHDEPRHTATADGLDDRHPVVVDGGGERNARRKGDADVRRGLQRGEVVGVEVGDQARVDDGVDRHETLRGADAPVA